jgi:transcriptional regulator with XRE-family HTH domain
MKTTLLDQIRRRRTNLSLKIQDMVLRAGLTRQQYGKIENGGNPRLSTLDQIAEGLECTLVLVPKEQLAAVQRLLEGDQTDQHEATALANEPTNPWDDMP